MEVVHQVQLANVAEVVIQYFHEQVDDFQAGKLVIRRIYAQGEIQASIPSVDKFPILVLRERERETRRDETREKKGEEV